MLLTATLIESPVYVGARGAMTGAGVTRTPEIPGHIDAQTMQWINAQCLAEVDG